MAKLIYSTSTSLDGYTVDEDGTFDWSAPDEEVHAFVNDRARPIGTYLCGRRLHEVMGYWDTILPALDEPFVVRDFAEIWRAADKVVYSRTLATTTSPRTRVERTFDPEAIRAMKASAERDICVGGATLAGQAIAAGLVDECRLFVVPILVGGGTRALPDGVRVPLELLDEHRFGSGVVYLRYHLRS